MWFWSPECGIWNLDAGSLMCGFGLIKFYAEIYGEQGRTSHFALDYRRKLVNLQA